MEVSIGEIEKKLSIILFKENSSYKNREKTLKDYINLCFEMSIQLVELPHKSKHKISHYKELRIKRSLRRICDYIAYLVSELERDKIINFCDSQKLFILNYDINTTFLLANSYYGSIETDIYWISDITIYEALDISAGKFDLTSLSKKLPNTVSKFKKTLLPYITNDKVFSMYTDILLEIDKAYDTKLLKACNLLIITLIEGLVRTLGNYLIEKQEIEVENYESLNSLDSFLRKINWKQDFLISQNQYRLLTGDFDFLYDKKPLAQLKITLKDRLDFLRRRFKEDRDLVLHGIDCEYGKEWHLFVNFSALLNVYDVIKYYRELYK